MNILFYESSIPPTRGGIARVSWTISRYLISKGYKVFFAYWINDSKEVKDQYKIRLKKEGKYESRNSLIKFITNNNIDVIINQGNNDLDTLRLLYKIKKQNAIKIVTFLHLSPNYFDYFKLNSFKLIVHYIIKLFTGMNGNYYLMKKIYNLSDLFILLSYSFKEDFMLRLKLKEDTKLHFIPNPLSFNIFLHRDDLINKKKQILIISRMDERQKNLKSALRIWKKIETTNKYPDWNLIIGGYGPDEEDILKYAASLNLNNFKFIGKVENPQDLFKESSIFMMTSKFEGFGMTLVEAMQNGCIPFAFDNFTVLHDIIEDNYNGFIIPSNDESIYAKKIENLIINNDKRKQIAENCITSCKKFSIENIGNIWIKMLMSLNKTNDSLRKY